MCGLVKGPRGALLKSEDKGDGRSDWDPAEINHRNDQLQASQAVGGSRAHSRALKHRTSIARIRVATPAQLRVVDKLLEPKDIELLDAAYEGSKLADDPRYGKTCGNSQLAKILAVCDRSDPRAAKKSSWRSQISRGCLRSCFGRKP